MRQPGSNDTLERVSQHVKQPLQIISTDEGTHNDRSDEQWSKAVSPRIEMRAPASNANAESLSHSAKQELEIVSIDEGIQAHSRLNLFGSSSLSELTIDTTIKRPSLQIELLGNSCRSDCSLYVQAELAAAALRDSGRTAWGESSSIVSRPLIDHFFISPKCRIQGNGPSTYKVYLAD
jgi:hypothetical protein